MAIGREAIVAGYSVLFSPATTLVAQLAKAHADGRLEERLLHYAKPKLLIVDELGYLPFEPDAGRVSKCTVACAYRPEAKGKVERPFRYVREDFFLARRFRNLENLNAQFTQWLDQIASRSAERSWRPAPIWPSTSASISICNTVSATLRRKSPSPAFWSRSASAILSSVIGFVLAGFDHQITGLRRGIARLIDGYAEGIIDRAEFEPRISGMKQRLFRLEEERRKAAEDAEVESNLALIIGRLEDFANKVHQSLDELDWNGTREIIRAMVRRIEIDGDHVNVVFRIPPSSEGAASPFGGTCPEGDNWQHCRGGHGGFAWEDADDIGAPLDLAVQAFQGVGGVQLGAQVLGIGHVGQHVELGLVHQGGQFGDPPQPPMP